MGLLDNLIANATRIKTETVDSANDAPRIGQMFLDIINYFKDNSSGSASAKPFDTDFVANPAFGKYAAGQTVPAAGKSPNDVLLDAFSNYLAPAFSSFTSAIASVLEVGASLTTPQAFSFVLANPANAKANTLKVIDITNSATLVTGAPVTSPVSVPVGAITKTANGATHSWRAELENSNSQVLQSTAFTATWRLKTFHGAVVSTPADSAAVRALASSTWDNTGTFVISLNSLKYAIALRSGKTLSKVITSVLEDITDRFIKTTVTVILADGVTTQSYDVYTFSSDEVMNTNATVTIL